MTNYEDKRAEWGSVSALVTGADGFLGAALVNRLLFYGVRTSVILHTVDRARPFFNEDMAEQAGYSPDISSRVEKTFLADIRDYDAVERAVVQSRPDIIFHLAAITQVKDAEIIRRQNYDTNVMGTVNVLEAAMQSPIHEAKTLPLVVTASSDKAYGEPLEEPLTEKTPFNPKHPYDASKASADLVAQSYGRSGFVPTIITRCANIYGPGDVNWQRLIPGVIREFMLGRPPVIRSDGSPVREYIYVEDVVSAYLEIVEHCILNGWSANGNAFNISPRDPRSVIQVVEAIRDVMGDGDLPEPIIEATSKTETQSVTLRDTKLRTLVGWSSAMPLKKGLVETVDWMARYLGEHTWRQHWYEERIEVE